MKTPRDVRQILDKLETQHPGADTELHYTTPFELLVATILSAQSTDARVNMVTPALFERYPDARALARATTGELEPQIHSTGFYRAKSKSLVGMAQALVAKHGGEVPARMDDLVELPGVGRKTANVVLGHALGVPGLPVDRHVLRVSNRRFIRQDFFDRSRNRSSAWRRRSLRRTAAKSRPTWTRSPRFLESDAKPRTSSSATRSAYQDCRSTATCCASPTVSGSPKARMRSKWNRSSVALYRASVGHEPRTR